MAKTKYYRNKIDITVKGQLIEAESLWMLQNNILVLVDDDQHVTAELDPDLFYQV